MISKERPKNSLVRGSIVKVAKDLASYIKLSPAFVMNSYPNDFWIHPNDFKSTTILCPGPLGPMAGR